MNTVKAVPVACGPSSDMDAGATGSGSTRKDLPLRNATQYEGYQHRMDGHCTHPTHRKRKQWKEPEVYFQVYFLVHHSFGHSANIY